MKIKEQSRYLGNEKQAQDAMTLGNLPGDHVIQSVEENKRENTQQNPQAVTE